LPTRNIAIKSVFDFISDWCKKHFVNEIKVFVSSSTSKELFEKRLSKSLPQDLLLEFYKHRGFTQVIDQDTLLKKL